MTSTPDSQETEDSQEAVNANTGDHAPPPPESFGPREQLFKNLEDHPEQIPVLLKKSDRMLKHKRWGKITDAVLKHAALIVVGTGTLLSGWGIGYLVHHGPNDEEKEKIAFAARAEQEIAHVRDSTAVEIKEIQQETAQKIAKIEKEANTPIRNAYNAAQVRLDKGKAYVSFPVKLLDPERKKELTRIFENAARANPTEKYPITWISDADNDLKDGRVFVIPMESLNDFIIVQNSIKAAIDTNIPENTYIAYRVKITDGKFSVIGDYQLDDKVTPGYEGDMRPIYP